jgi:folate-binding protein YgfZ
MPAEGRSVVLPLGETTVRVLRHRSVTGAGLRLLCAPEDVSAVREYLSDRAGIPLVGAAAFALWRIDRLLPAVGHELSALANPLEAGAAAAVDFEKGCYIGQEVIARLDSYDKVQRVPRRIRRDPEAEQFPNPGSVLYADGKNAGFVTTLIHDPREGAERGIALVRHAFAAPGTQLSLQPDGDARPFSVEALP